MTESNENVLAQLAKEHVCFARKVTIKIKLTLVSLNAMEKKNDKICLICLNVTLQKAFFLF